MTTVCLRKVCDDGCIKSVEFTFDKNHCLGRCRGSGNYVVRKPSFTHYRVESMLPYYHYYKSLGYKFFGIY